MKEATSELASLLVVVSSVAILIAFFYFTVWPLIDNNFKKQTACEKATCKMDQVTDGYVNCELNGQEFRCKYKG